MIRYAKQNGNRAADKRDLRGLQFSKVSVWVTAFPPQVSMSNSANIKHKFSPVCETSDNVRIKLKNILLPKEQHELKLTLQHLVERYFFIFCFRYFKLLTKQSKT